MTVRLKKKKMEPSKQQRQGLEIHRLSVSVQIFLFYFPSALGNQNDHSQNAFVNTAVFEGYFFFSQK